MRVNPVARRRARAGGGGSAAPHRAGPAAPGGSRPYRRRAARRRAPGPQGSRRCSASEDTALPALEGFMTPQEKDLLTTLLGRLKSAGGQPKEPEADTLIRQALAEQPDMPYYLTQTVLIQDLSLHQAQQRIADLEKQLADAQQAAKPSATSFLGGLFGSRPSAPPAGPPPAGPWTRSPQVAGAPPAQPYGQPGGYAQPGYGQ